MYTNFRATSKPQRVVSRQSACHVNENLKMANLIYRQMPAPWELPQQIFPPGKSLDAESWGEVNANTLGAWYRFGMVMNAIDTCTNSLVVKDTYVLSVYCAFEDHLLVQLCCK